VRRTLLLGCSSLLFNFATWLGNCRWPLWLSYQVDSLNHYTFMRWADVGPIDVQSFWAAVKGDLDEATKLAAEAEHERELERKAVLYAVN